MKAIIIAGNWASGKSELVKYYHQKLDQFGIPTIIDSDRIRFEEAVLRDAKGNGWWDENNKRYVGAHSYLTRDGEPGHRHFMVRSGTIPNQEHSAMIADIASTPEGTIRLVEFALANDIREFEGEERTPFFQSGQYLLELLRRHGVGKDIVIIEIIAPVEVRLSRQVRRDASTDMEAFRAFAADGGELEHQAHVLNKSYIAFHNAHTDLSDFHTRADEIFVSDLFSRIVNEGNGNHWEGQRRQELG